MGTDMVELTLRLDKSGRVSLSRRHGGEGLDELLAYFDEHISKLSPSLSEDLSGSICSAVLSNGADSVIADSLGWEDGVLVSVEDIRLSCTVRLQGSDSLVLAVVEEVCREIAASEDDVWGDTVTLPSRALFDKDAYTGSNEDVYAVGREGDDALSDYDDYSCDDDEEDGDHPFYGDNPVSWD